MEAGTVDTPENKNKQPLASEETQLTPWQKEHQLYLAAKGIKKAEKKEDEKDGKDEKKDEIIEETLVTSEEELTKATAEQEATTPSFFHSFADYLPNLKAYRDKKLKQRLLCLTLLFLLPLTGAFYVLSPLNRVSKVMVTGNSQVLTQEVLDASKLQTNEKLWPQFFKRQAAGKDVQKSNPWIKKAQVRLTNWNQFEIQITEYQKVALLDQGSQYLPILENGRIIDEPSPNYENNFLILEAFSDKKMILQTLSAYNELPTEIQEGISQIQLSPSSKNQERLTVLMNDGNQVLINISSLASKLKYYPQIAKEMTEKGIVDMEVGIYSYPYASEKETTSTTSESLE